MDSFSEGLRCQDVTLGLRELHPLSAELHLVRNTHLVGMAADLAGLIRGRDVISHVESLEIVASETLDIPPLVLPQVLRVLADCEMLDLDTHDGRVNRIIERVPVYQDLYSLLGYAWRERHPRQIEQELLVVVNRLATSPIPLETLTTDLGVDKSDLDRLYRLGVDTSIFMTVETGDGALLYSPYMAFENPSKMYQALVSHGSGQLAEAMDRIARYQGYPVSSASDPVLADAVGRGLIAAPAVMLPEKTMQAFATLPYTFDRSLTRDRKPLLDKALAIVACVRCGQHFGGTTNTRDAVLVLEALAERECLSPHSSHERQYKLLRDLGVIRFLQDTRPNGTWVRPSLIRTDENLEAVRLAITLIQGQESFRGRESDEGVKKLLGLDARSLKPLQVAHRTPVKRFLAERELSRAFDNLLGRGEL
jgi:hypothetical protein